MLTHGNLLSNIEQARSTSNRISADDVVYGVIPAYHIFGLNVVLGLSLSAGACVVLVQRFDPATALESIRARKVTVVPGSPSVWVAFSHFDEAPADALAGVKLALSGAAKLPVPVSERILDRFGVAIAEGYGLTEASPIVTSSAGLPPLFGSVGRVLSGVELRIVDDDGTVLPWDGEAVGEIECRGSWITGSYYGDPAPEKFDDGWLRTGDIASVTPNGYVKISDRSKDVIKSGGEWISSVELEGHLMGHPDVVEAAVIAVPDPRWDERPLACVVCREGAGASASDLREFLSSHVAKWQLPERWTFIGEVPKTSVGKFDKKVLRARYADGELVVEEL
jgi:fatty-acyl-CoA synthase